MAISTSSVSNESLDYDVIVIGAGVSGICQLYHLRSLGFTVRAFEDASDVGGTWYWNRYPGCRFDSESETYSFSFSQEVLDEWQWKEHFSSQPENFKYCQYVAKKFDLYNDIQFNTRVTGAYWQEGTRTWKVVTDKGDEVTSRFFITAVGPLSAPTMPGNLDASVFKGQSYQTARWPHEPVTLEGKRIAVIGTGATGIQTIQEVAKIAQHLTVFQRSPNWGCPLYNSAITEQEMADIRKNYPAILERCNSSVGCFIHEPDPRSVFDVTQEEREAFWEKLYSEPGFGIWMGNFRDILVDSKANQLMSDWLANKIRQRVSDPVTAEKLIPKDHGFGTKRLPLETNYFEVYNQSNIDLVDLRETPIERVTEKGIMTSDREREFDVIIYATGFEGFTGSHNRIDIRGVGGEKLKDRWTPAPQTFLGLMVNNFPNMLMVVGPHSAVGNITRIAEYFVGWINKLLLYAKEHNITRLEPTKEAVDEWTEHVVELGVRSLAFGVDSWMTGVNTNVQGKSQRIVARYYGTAVMFRERADEIARNGYREIAQA